MVVDQRLMMGIVFIVAGVALALLAYAAFLYRKTPDDLADKMEPAELDKEQEGVGPGEEAPAAPEMNAEGEAEAGEASVTAEDDYPSEETDDAGEPAEAAADAAVEVEPESAAERDRSETEEPGESLEETDEEPSGAEAESTAPPEPEPVRSSTVTLSQSTETGRLLVEVNGEAFQSAQELRDSEQWRKVAPILRDTVAWLTVAEAEDAESEEAGEGPRAEAGYTRAASMVEQIDSILQEKLASAETTARGVRLVEGADGSIRVYVGVSSYLMDQVPDAEVRRLIREAVAEWESRQ